MRSATTNHCLLFRESAQSKCFYVLMCVPMICESIDRSSAEDFRELCENTSCPDAREATFDDCCIHHSNVHSCAPSVSCACVNMPQFGSI